MTRSGHGDVGAPPRPDDLVKYPLELLEVEQRLQEAEAATNKEHELSLWQALRLYPKASAWSIALSFAVVIDGFDLVLLNSLYAYPAFRTEFGQQSAKGGYQISAPCQAGLSNASKSVKSLNGLFLGLIINGWAAERFGYKKVMITALFAMTAFIFVPSSRKFSLRFGELLCGIPWGVFQTLTTAYASEVVPVALRPYLTTWVNACWGIGQLISLGVLRGLLRRTDEWGWRIPFALQWIWPPPLLIICFLAPESPWWLVRRCRLEDAKNNLLRLTTKGQGDEVFSVDEQVAMMVETHRLETEVTKGATYLDLFRGVDLRRTECVCGAWACQQVSGSAFLGITAYFLEQAGMSTTHAFDLSMGQYAINTGGVLIAWTFMTWGLGRLTLYLYGLTAMFTTLVIIGAASFSHTNAASWAIGGMLLAWSVCYQTTVGTIAYSLVSELSSRRLLIKSINLGRGLYAILGIINSTFNPVWLHDQSYRLELGGKTGFFWSGFCLLCLFWSYFRLPEPKGLTYAEIDQLFALKVSARQFLKVGLEMFARDREVFTKQRARVDIAKELLGVDEGEVKGKTDGVHVE